MADTTAEWRRQAPKGMHAIIYQRRCGWHVLLHETGPTISSVLAPVLLGKSCVPYKVDPTCEDKQSQSEALAIGLYNIAAGVREECRWL